MLRNDQPLVADLFAGAPKAIRYTHAGFQEAAIEWLIDTDQASHFEMLEMKGTVTHSLLSR